MRRVLTRCARLRCGRRGQERARPVEPGRALTFNTDLASTMPRYTQGLMDLGAGICLPRSRRCPLRRCSRSAWPGALAMPSATRCARASSSAGPKAWWLLLRQDGAGRRNGFLERRASIWAGLYCPPVYASRQDLDEALAPAVRSEVQDLPAFTHVLHRDHLHRCWHAATAAPAGQCSDDGGRLVHPERWRGLGLRADAWLTLRCAAYWLSSGFVKLIAFGACIMGKYSGFALQILY